MLDTEKTYEVSKDCNITLSQRDCNEVTKVNFDKLRKYFKKIYRTGNNEYECVESGVVFSIKVTDVTPGDALLSFDRTDEMFDVPAIITAKEFLFKGNQFVFTRRNNNCVRAEEIVDAINFRCEEESCEVILFVNNEGVRFVETRCCCA